MSLQFADRPGGAAQRPDPATALIGRDGLSAFREQGEQALAAVIGALDGAQGVFDGARPGDIAGGIAAIDELGALVFRLRPSLAMGTDELDGLNEAIRGELAAAGEAMIAATRVGGRRYLKFTLMNANTTIDAMAELLDLIAATGQRLATAGHTKLGGSACVDPAVARHG